MRGLADPRVLIALSVVGWSCAKATDSDLAGGSYNPHAAGGTGAVSSTGGSFATGGSSGGSLSHAGNSAGGGSAFGGGTATGGTSTTGGSTSTGGSSTSAGGSTSTGGSSTSSGGSTTTGGTGTSGTTSEGGAAGEGIPPVLDNADVVVHYIVQEPAATSQAAQMHLYFENKADDALALKNVRVRYWMTSEAPHFDLHCYYAAAAVSVPTLAYVDAGKLSYIEATFASGSVPAHSGDAQSMLNSYEFQIALQTTNGGTEQQDNDWSFDAAATSSPAVPNPKITAYAGTKLVWGCEPSGACAGEGGGEGGAAGQGGEAGQPGQGGQPAQGGSAGGGGTAGAGGTAGGGGTAAGQGGDTSLGGQAGI